MSDIPRRAAARTAKLASLPLGVAGRAAAGWAGGWPAATARRSPPSSGAHRRAAVRRARRAQGRRDEVRPGAVGLRGGAARGAGRPVPRGADQAAGGRAADADPRRAPGARRAARPPAGATGSASSTTRPPPPRASARCTARCGTTAARSRSRCSTRAPARRCCPTCASWPGWPAAAAAGARPGRQAAGRRAAGAHRRGARLPRRGGEPARVRRGVRRRPDDRGAAGRGPAPQVLVTEWVSGRRCPRSSPTAPRRSATRRGAARAVPLLRARPGRAAARRPAPGQLPAAARRPAAGARLRRGRPAARRPAQAAGRADRLALEDGRTTSSPGCATRGSCSRRSAVTGADAARLPRAVRGAAAHRDVPLHPALDAQPGRPGRRPAQLELRRRRQLNLPPEYLLIHRVTGRRSACCASSTPGSRCATSSGGGTPRRSSTSS